MNDVPMPPADNSYTLENAKVQYTQGVSFENKQFTWVDISIVPNDV